MPDLIKAFLGDPGSRGRWPLAGCKGRTLAGAWGKAPLFTPSGTAVALHRDAGLPQFLFRRPARGEGHGEADEHQRCIALPRAGSGIEQAYLAALDRVPRVSRQTLDRGMAFLLKLADTLSQMGYSNVKLARLLADRERMTEALRESEHFYRQTLESIPGMVFTTRPDGYCDFQSQQWVDYTGVPMEEHTGDGWNRLLHPDDRPRARQAWCDAVEGKAPYDLEYRVRRRDGQYEWFKVRGTPIRDEEGNIARWFGVAANIETIKRAEQGLRDSEERFRLLSDTAGQLLTTQDPQGLVEDLLDRLLPAK